MMRLNDNRYDSVRHSQVTKLCYIVLYMAAQTHSLLVVYINSSISLVKKMNFAIVTIK